MSAQTSLQSSDVWLLLAISASSGSLAGVISAGDAINHAIFTDEELQCGIYALKNQGLVEQRKERLFLTAAAKRLLKPHGRKLHYDSWKALERDLRIEPQASPKRDRPRDMSFSGAEIASAYGRYRARWARLDRFLKCFSHLIFRRK